MVPRVSIITINFNNSSYTRALLQSLLQCKYTNLEVIVVDNNSSKSDFEELLKIESQFLLIPSPENLGFAGANNLGINFATGEFIFFINNDTILEQDAITNMVKALAKNPGAGAISPIIRYLDSPYLIQFAGFSEMSPIIQRMKAIAKNQAKYPYQCEPKQIAYAHGCAMMVKREVIEVVGTMPEKYFLYYEELDWCTKIKKHEYSIWLQPNSVIYHKASASTGVESPLQVYFKNRNRILFLRRNYKGLTKLLAFVYLLTFSFPNNVLRQVFNKNIRGLTAYINAWLWHFSAFKNNYKKYVSI